MRFICFTLIFALIIISALVTGCASVGGGQSSGINWALAKNGGRVSAFSDESTHPASALIDGITTTPVDWEQGGGWQASIMASTSGSRSVRTERDEMERNWVIIELSQPITVNEVRIYTVDSVKYPAAKFGISDLLVQYELKTASQDLLWANVNRPGKGMGNQDNVIRGNKSGIINVRFEPVLTQKIRVLIYNTNDMAMTEDNKSKEGTIRLTEIEVYGSGKQQKRSDVDELFQK